MQVKNFTFKFLFFLLMNSFLVACGGGGAGGSETANQSPIVNAGATQTANEQSQVSLHATATDADGSIVSYRWIQLSGPSVTLNQASSAHAQFLAPAVTENQELVFQITVTDNQGATDSDTTSVQIRNVNQSPIVNAGPDQSAVEQTEVTLSAQGLDDDGSIVSYRWTQLSGSSVSLSNATSATAQFVAPDLVFDESLQFQITVTDNQGATAVDTVSIHVTAINQAPTLTTDSDQAVNEQALVSLTASAQDVDGTIVSYLWEQVAGTSVSLVDANRPSVSFVAPGVATDETLSFDVTVTDDDDATTTARLNLVVHDVPVSPALNQLPMVSAASTQTLPENTLFTLSAVARDTDGYIASYRWTQIQGTSVVFTDTSSASIQLSAPSLSTDETLRFAITVTDNLGAIAQDEVSIQIQNINQLPLLNAGLDRDVDEQTVVILTAQASDPDGTISRFHWEQLTGTPVSLTNALTASVQFTTPDLANDEVSTFRITVTDDQGATTSDEITLQIHAQATVPPANTAPVVSAGADQLIHEKSLVTLTASASDVDGSVIQYQWQQTGGTSVLLNNGDQATATFTAPDVAADETYRFTITVTDDDGSTASDEISVQITHINQAPSVNAGGDQTVSEQSLVTLSASALDSDGQIASYLWTQLTGTGVILNDATSEQAHFAAPDLSSDEIVTFKIVVTDNEGASSEDEIAILVQATNQAPSVNAGFDQTVLAETQVTLTASASDSDGSIASYQWQQLSGTVVSLSNANSASTQFTSANVSHDETATFQITVTDNKGAVASDRVAVTIQQVIPPVANRAPSVSAGADQTIQEQSVVTLSAVGQDSDGTVVSYQWAQISGSPVTLADAGSATTHFTAPDVSANQIATFEVRITDDDGATARDTVAIQIMKVNRPPQLSAGTDQSIDEQTLVQLTASASDTDGSIVSYRWTQISGPVVALTSTNAATLTFTAPDISIDTQLQFSIQVTDNDGASVADEIAVHVNKVNQLPQVSAGSVQTVDELSDVTLTGSASDPDGTIQTVEWRQTTGLPVLLISSNSLSASFTAPDIETDETLVFTLTITDNDGGESTASVQILVTNVIVATGMLNDTGLQTCSDASVSGLACPVLGFEGQDAAYGRDVAHDDDTDGNAGFNLAKVAANGELLAADATEWHCVLDEVTGLYWEVKTDDDGLQDKDLKYSWYKPTGLNGGNEGSQTLTDCSGVSCNTHAYAAAINSMALCGFSDWRVPTKAELESILDYSQTPAIDRNYFPYGQSVFYWTDTSSSTAANFAWLIHFSDGLNSIGAKTNKEQLRLVRATER